jgi:hypothetical protein
MSKSFTRFLVIVGATLGVLVFLAHGAFAAPSLPYISNAQPTTTGVTESGPTSGPASGPTSGPAAGPSSASQTDPDGDNDANDPNDNDANDAQDQNFTGTVASIDAANASFDMTTASGTIKVHTNAQTEFKDGLASLADLRAGMTVTADGAIQSDGHVLANEVKGSNDSDGNDASDGD